MEEKKNYICVRHEKKKSKRGLDGKEKHNKDDDFRKTLDHINPDMTDKNRTIYTDAYDQTKTLYENFEMMADNYKAVKGRKLRSDAVQCIETVYTISSGVIDANNEEEVKKFENAVLECHKKTFGDCPAIISTHVDESTVHSHVLTVGIDKNGKTYNKKVLNKKAFEEIQTEFAKCCQKNGIDVVRGESKAKTKARHKNVKAFMETEEGKQWIEKKKQEELNKALETIDTEFETIITEIQQENESIINGMQQSYDQKKKDIQKKYEKEKQALEKDIKQDLERYYKNKLSNGKTQLDERIKKQLKAEYNEMYEKAYKEEMKKIYESLGFNPEYEPSIKDNDKDR